MEAIGSRSVLLLLHILALALIGAHALVIFENILTMCGCFGILYKIVIFSIISILVFIFFFCILS